MEVRHFWRSGQDRRDQCASVSDTDPKNEVGDAPGPADRNVIAPCANACGNQISNAKKSKRRDAGSNHETHPPPPRCRLFDNAGNTFRHQLKLRWFKTRGTCAIRRSACWILSGAVADAPSILSRAHSGKFSTLLAMPTSFASGIFGFGLRRRAR